MNVHIPYITICNNICKCSSNIIITKFSTSTTFYKIIPKNLKRSSKSSHDWLTRHLNDPYVKMAKQNHYRARSAFKLLEIDEKYKLLTPGQLVVECGAAPGAWTQVIVPKINSKNDNAEKPVGKVIAIDINNIYTVEGAVMMGLQDFTSETTQKLIQEELNGQKVDLVLSDMAPRASGSRELDHPAQMDLASAALKFAVNNAKRGSNFLCKVWTGYRLDQFLADVNKHYQSSKIVKPSASRTDSPETFILARNMKK